MSKRIALPIVFCALTLFPNQFIFSIFDAEAGVGFATVNYSDNGSPSANGTLLSNHYTGYSLQGSAHINFAASKIISIGIGPYLVSGPNMKWSGESSVSGLSYFNYLLMVGGEMQVKTLATTFVFPYVKAGLGYDTITTVFTISGVSTQLQFTGVGFRMAGGIEIPITQNLFLFAEGGYFTGSYAATLINISGYKAKADSYILTFGVGLSI